MSIRCVCACGASLLLPADMAGRVVHCPACRLEVTIPAPEGDAEHEEAAHALAAERGAEPPPPPFAPGFQPAASLSVTEHHLPAADDLAQRRGSPREYLYLLLAFALVPLVVSVLLPETRSTEDRLRASLEHAGPDTEARLKALATEEGIELEPLLAALPGGKIEGAALPRDTRAHWLLGAAAAVAFWVFTLLVFPGEIRSSASLLKVGLFTGTVGIVLLLGFQFAAAATQGVWLHGRGVVMLLFYLVKFIGWSYASADNPESSFVLSFVGFTCGVGLCEELCKALPMLRRFTRGPGMGWRNAAVWGLASGVGFGVAEGILYSARFYNGLATPTTYVVRFVSCVALHALWSAAVGIALWKRQDTIRNNDDPASYAVAVLKVLAVPMILHGLYDTLLKKDIELGALAIGALTFAWFVYQVESARATDEPLDALDPHVQLA